MELSLQNLLSLSHLCYPTDTHQLTSPQGEADGVSDGGMMLQALGGVNLPCGWYRVRGQLPFTGGQEHTQIWPSSSLQAPTSDAFLGTVPLAPLPQPPWPWPPLPLFPPRPLQPAFARAIFSLPMTSAHVYNFCKCVGGICSFARILPCFHDSVDRVRPAKSMSWINTFPLL
jgi:hypothetical protein